MTHIIVIIIITYVLKRLAYKKLNYKQFNNLRKFHMKLKFQIFESEVNYKLLYRNGSVDFHVKKLLVEK